MALIKIQRFFGAVPNDLLNNPEISFKAKGLYAYLNSKPDNWDFSVEGIAAQVKEGIDSVRAGIHELEKFGYLKRIKHQNEKGHWDIDYMLFEVPMDTEASLGKSNEGEDPKQYKKEYTKKENTKKENIIKEKTENLIPERKQKFAETLKPFCEKYGREMLNSFYQYWTELNETGTKMRMDKEQFFDISRRLATWKRNEEKHFASKNNGSNIPEHSAKISNVIF